MANNEGFASLTTMQQGKLMRAIDEIKKKEDPEEAMQDVLSICAFLDALEAYEFITPAVHTRYFHGVNDAFKSRRKEQ
jgi:hypothetical protein